MRIVFTRRADRHHPVAEGGAGTATVAPAACLPPAAVKDHVVYVEPMSETVSTSAGHNDVAVPNAGVIYVDTRHRASPPFLTWLEQLRRSGVEPAVKPVSASDLADLRRTHEVPVNEPESVETEQSVLSEARQFLRLAAAAGGSDITILRRRDVTDIQLRIDGDIRTSAAFSKRAEEGDRFIRAIFRPISRKP
jgi:type II secretory ATPase GspE/PulE/Tfp pilus assembly ATPase PilB-like protein